MGRERGVYSYKREVPEPSARLRNNLGFRARQTQVQILTLLLLRIYVFLENELPLSRPVSLAVNWKAMNPCLHSCYEGKVK